MAEESGVVAEPQPEPVVVPTKDGNKFSMKNFIESGVPTKIGIVLGLVVVSRLGVYIHLPGVDVQAYQDAIARGDPSAKNQLL